MTPESPIAVNADADARIMIFTASLAMLTALAAGIVPAFRSTGIDIAPTLKSAGGAVVSEQPTLRKTLVVAQVALSFLLLIGAGLFLRSLDNLLSVDPGFRTTEVLSFAFDLERNGYQGERSRTFARTVHDTLRSTPGVVSASYAFFGMLEGGGWGMGFTVEGYQPPAGDSAGAMCNGVSPGFFKEMGVPLVAGREFDERDTAITPAPKDWPYRVAIVNQTFVRRYFKGGNRSGGTSASATILARRCRSRSSASRRTCATRRSARTIGRRSSSRICRPAASPASSLTCGRRAMPTR